MLIGVELPQEYIESIIFTGRLKSPFAPVSTLIIGAPESGKTSIVSSKQVKSVVSFTDVTGKGLIECCKLNPEVTHIVLNDLVAIMSHKMSVNRYTMSMLNAITEEGIQAMAFPSGIDVVANGKRGVIACLTSDLMKDGRSWWNKIGFASRMLPFGFSHSGTLSLRIKDVIDTATKTKEKTQILKVPSAQVHVDFAPKYVAQVRKIADEKAKELEDPTGYRRLKQFRSLVCGHALRRGGRRPAVSEVDIEFLHEIFPFISYTKLPQL